MALRIVGTMLSLLVVAYAVTVDHCSVDAEGDCLSQERVDDIEAAVVNVELLQRGANVKHHKVKTSQELEAVANLTHLKAETPKQLEDPKWHLGANINPCDGHNFGYGGPWEGNSAVGSDKTAFTHDFLNTKTWSAVTGYVAIARHVNGVCEMAKTWALTDKSQSLHSYFSTYPGRLTVTGDGSENDQHIHADIPEAATGLSTDPIFGANGGLAFNWYYANNGARIAVPGGYKDPYNLPGTGENNDDLHGLGNEFGANTINGDGSGSWWHDAAQVSGDCHGPSCNIIGTDHGTNLNDGECGVQYAIYVSTSATHFDCHGRSLTTSITQDTAADQPHAKSAPALSRFIFIEQKKKWKYINLLQVIAFDASGAIIAPLSATMSKQWGTSVAENCIDGVVDMSENHDKMCHTTGDLPNWLQIDLGAEVAVSTVVVYNRIGTYAPRIEGATMSLCSQNHCDGGASSQATFGKAQPVYTFVTPSEEPKLPAKAPATAPPPAPTCSESDCLSCGCGSCNTCACGNFCFNFCGPANKWCGCSWCTEMLNPNPAMLELNATTAITSNA